MKHFFAIATVCTALLLVAACSPATNTNTNTNTNTAKPASTAAAPAGTPAAANQGAAQDFTLVNKTGVEIDKVFISPHDADDWEEDILGRDTLPSGESVDIKFHRAETAQMWDLRVEDSKGNAIEWENLNLLQISKATLFYENGKARAELE
jgi:hypothetical protein